LVLLMHLQCFRGVLMGLNPVKEWIAMLYILTTLLPFLSPTPVDHLRHMQLVLEWLQSAGLNLMVNSLGKR